MQGFSGAEVKMNGAVKVAGKSDGGAVTGLWSWNGGKVEVVEDAQIKAVSDTGNVIGINSNNNGGISSDRALTQIGGNTVIEVAGAVCCECAESMTAATFLHDICCEKENIAIKD